MLQDPVHDVLNPFTPTEAEMLGQPAVKLTGLSAQGITTWEQAGDVVIDNGKTQIALKEFLPLLGKVVPETASYEAAYSFSLEEHYAEAVPNFMACVLTGQNPMASVYGAAAAMAKMGRYARAEKLALFVAETEGFDNPKAYALAGYCAMNRKAAKTTRVHLSKASRLARVSTDYRDIQKFAQRLLLIQQFGSGDAD